MLHSSNSDETVKWGCADHIWTKWQRAFYSPLPSSQKYAFLCCVKVWCELQSADTAVTYVISCKWSSAPKLICGWCIAWDIEMSVLGSNSFEGLRLFEFKVGWVGSCSHYFFFSLHHCSRSMGGHCVFHTFIFHCGKYTVPFSMVSFSFKRQDCKYYLWYHKQSVLVQYSAYACVMYTYTKKWRNKRSVFNDKGVEVPFDIFS